MLLPQPRPPTDVTKRGISLAFLRSLVDSGALKADWTIQQCVDDFVRPVSAAFACCLFDLVPEAHAGPPKFFISHTWCAA